MSPKKTCLGCSEKNFFKKCEFMIQTCGKVGCCHGSQAILRLNDVISIIANIQFNSMQNGSTARETWYKHLVSLSIKNG